jgi:hypothetical protein
MELNDAYVLELTDRARGFAHTWNADNAEGQVGAKLREARDRFTQDGVDLMSADAAEKLEEQARQRFDLDAVAAGTSLEGELQGAAAVVADRIEAAKVLPATIEPLVSRQERQLEELAALMTEDRFRARFERQTRREAVAAYEQADEQTQVGRRLVVFLETSWPTVAFRDDPDSDAIALQRMRAAMETRQVARVPKALLEWRGHLDRAQHNIGLTETLRHLRSGRGIAKRPKPLSVQVA